MRALQCPRIALAGLLVVGAAHVAPTAAGERRAATVELIRIQGRVLDTLDGGRLSGAGVRIVGGPRTRSKPNGGYRLKFTDELGVYPVKVHRSTHWTRQGFFDIDRTTLRRVKIDLLPKSGDFDMAFFDFVFRRDGQSGTLRWTEQPVFEIITNTFVCQAGAPPDADIPCLTLAFKALPAPDFFLETMPRVIQAGVPLMSGGVLHDPVVRMRTIPAGAVLGIDDLQRPGVVFVAFGGTPRPTFAFTTTFWDASSALISSFIMFGNASFSEALGYHELAHSVGFFHPGGQGSVPGGSEVSLMNFASMPTEKDLLHAAVLYRRPPGSRHPDRDPDTVALQLALAEGRMLPRHLRLHSLRNECSGVTGPALAAARP